MKLLYLSCHAILEYDELKLFEELGIEYFSLGSYINPLAPVDPIRPALTRVADPEIYHSAPDRNAIPKEFFDHFDVIIIMHLPEWIENNWQKMKHKRVIWRTIGQCTAEHERRLAPYKNEGLEIVRYSPREERIPGYIGANTVIRFYKDPAEFGNWNGNTQEVITFAQNMKERGEFCHYEVFEKATEGLNAHVYGPKNANLGPLNGGFLTYSEMQAKYRDSRVYLYTGTQPASYVLNFIEAWMSGIPIVAVGPEIGNSMRLGGELYEIPDLIETDTNGYVTDDINHMKHLVNVLYNSSGQSRKIGERGRAKAIELFGKDTIKAQWKAYLGV